MTDRLETYEAGSPWITYHYLTTDRQTRLTGRSKILLACAICGVEETVTLRIPRVGPVPAPKGGRHEKRVEFVRAHQHTAEQRMDRTLWVRPLRNVAGMYTANVMAMVENAIQEALREHRSSRPASAEGDPT